MAGKRGVPGAYTMLKFVRDMLVVILVAVLVSFLLKTFLIRSFYIPSGSMENTLQVDDRVLVNQLAPQLSPINRGDIIVFKDPGGWILGHPQPQANGLEKILQFIGLQPDTSNTFLIKRVLGVGGDTVKCCNAKGQLEINGVAVKEPYVKLPQGENRASGTEFEVTVPKGKLWVMGDNRYGSLDSRFHTDQPGDGFVSEKEVVGRAFLRNWPLQRIGWLSNHQEIFAPIPRSKD